MASLDRFLRRAARAFHIRSFADEGRERTLAWLIVTIYAAAWLLFAYNYYIFDRPSPFITFLLLFGLLLAAWGNVALLSRWYTAGLLLFLVNQIALIGLAEWLFGDPLLDFMFLLPITAAGFLLGILPALVMAGLILLLRLGLEGAMQPLYGGFSFFPVVFILHVLTAFVSGWLSNGLRQAVESANFYAAQAHRATEEARQHRGELVEALEQLRMTRRILEDSNRQLELARDQAEAANQAKGRFLSLVSHEIRTPLSLVVGMSDWLLHRLDEPGLDLPTLRPGVGQLHSSAEHLGRLIGDVLDLASSEAGRLRLAREPLELGEVLQAAAAIGGILAREKGLDFQVRLPREELWVLGDRTRLRQVTLNLISNAVKYTPAGCVRLEAEREQEWIEVRVVDTGIGVLPEEETGLFERFNRSERVLRQGYTGMGLGLAISKMLVEMHDGEIGVRSGGKGQGATFTFRLPAISRPARLSVPPDLRRLPLAVLTDGEAASPLLAQLEARGLEFRSYPVTDSDAWLTWLLAFPPVSLILDASLAARRGWEILALLKRYPLTENLPVLVCSLGADGSYGPLVELDYRTKPLTAEQLVQTLDQYGMPPRSAGGPRTILVVDDDPGMLNYHAMLVRQHDASLRVIEARNGREALEVMRQSIPDLVLLDLMMPEVDGFAVLEEMRRSDRTRGAPVIVLTAKLLTDEDMARLNQGMTAVLSKGMYRYSELLDRIQQVLDRQQSLGLPSQRLARKAAAFIQAHYAEPLTRGQIAYHVGLSANRLTEYFHQEMGMPPLVYLNRYRILQARRLLELKQMSIGEVCAAVGFNDSSHFSRLFRREVGVSPREFQQGRRGSAADAG